MMVKICGVTNIDDALAAVDNGASAIGFNFYPKSPRYITANQAEAIADVLPSNVLKVGVIVGAAAPSLPVDILQVHGDDALPPGRVWKAVRVGASFRLEDLEHYPADAFLLDSPSDTLHGGTGQTFNWSLAAGASRKIILAGGLDASNVRAAIDAARPWGVDACSRLESAPGKKDHVKMAQFLKAALDGF